jgi:hypothetical protein
VLVFLHDCYNLFLGVGLVSQNKFHQPDFLRTFSHFTALFPDSPDSIVASDEVTTFAISEASFDSFIFSASQICNTPNN